MEFKATSRAAEIEMQHVAASYQLADGRFEVRDLAADLLHGRLNAHMTVRHLDRTPQVDVSASVAGIALDALQQVPRNRSFKPSAAHGNARGQNPSFLDRESRKPAGVLGFLRTGSRPQRDATAVVQMLPAQGAAHVDYDRRKNSLTFSQTSLEAASTSLVVEGEVSDHSNLEIHASASDLGQVALLASVFGAGGSAGASQSFRFGEPRCGGRRLDR